MGWLKRNGRAVLALLVVALVVCLGPSVVSLIRALTPPALPDNPPVTAGRWLDQNWNADQRAWYHHASQGTSTFGIPFEWFVALEQPGLTLGRPGLLSDTAYLERFGFIPNELGGGAKGMLPVGIAAGAPVIDPTTGKSLVNPVAGQPFTQIGLSCAACHSGRLDYKGTAILVDGGSPVLDLGKFRKALGQALVYLKWPGRFGRFADRVLGTEASDEARAVLKAELTEVGAALKISADLDALVGIQTECTGERTPSTCEGVGRLDALNRIGNTVFALDTKLTENYAPVTAPVSLPHIWDAPWFDWVQYDASIMQPMVRNAGEALGVSAPVNLSNPDRPLFASLVPVETLFEMESLLAGTPPYVPGGKPPQPERKFQGLVSPRWPTDILPPVDQKLVDAGADLYRDRCQGCHLPPVRGKDQAFWDGKYWTEIDKYGRSYLKLKEIPLSELGTDSAQADVLRNRVVTTPDYLKVVGPDGIPTTAFPLALGYVVEKTVNAWYDTNKIGPDRREELNGYRPNKLQAPDAYKARPLDGVWATAPYLHNGSVPTLYDLLSPVAERPATFWTGSRQFDPVKVGFETGRIPGSVFFDAALPGNSNRGHEFNDVKGPGVIGPGLSPDQRKALIEFLKTQ